MVADVSYAVRPPPTPVDPDAPLKLKRLYRAVLGDAEAEFRAEVDRLTALVRSTDPLYLLAEMTVGHLFHPAGFDAERDLADPLIQFHLEWLQAFCLRFPLAEYRPSVPLDPKLAWEISDRLRQLPELSIGVLYRQHEQKFGRAPSGQIEGSWEQELARIERLARRNWSYRGHMVETVTRLCEPLDDWASAQLGYQLSAIPPLLMNIEAEVERRVNHQRRITDAVMHRSGSAIGRCRRWEQSGLPGSGQATELERDLQAGRLSPVELVSAFNRAIEHLFPALFSFSIADLEALSEGQLGAQSVETLMGRLSFRFGELGDQPPEHFILGNPIWTRPFIELDEATFFCPLPPTALSHSLDLVGALVRNQDSLLWGQTRAAFLQARMEEVIARAFPTATLYPNSKSDNPQFENDLAAVIDDAVVILEARAHQVDDGSRRGGPKGMRGNIKELVLKPSAQGRRFANYLFETSGPRPLRHEATGDFVIDSTSIHSAILANVVLDPFTVARVATRNLRSATLLRDDEPDPAPTYLLADLDAILALLPDELQRLHYLARRQILQNRCWYHAEEHDLLAVYVDTGFNLPELEKMEEPVILWGLARKYVDPYLEEALAGRVRRPRPERRLQPGWRRILEHLRRKRPPDWVTMGMALLDASAAQQHQMVELTKRTVREVATSNKETAVGWWSMDVGLPFWRSTIAGVVTQGVASEEWENLASAMIKKHSLGVETSCTVLYFDTTASRKAPSAFYFHPGENNPIA